MSELLPCPFCGGEAHTIELRFTAKCDFCGKSAEYVWLLFESSDGKNHICNECVQNMMETMYCIADGCDDEAVGE